MSSNNEEKDSQNNSNNESDNIPLQPKFNSGSDIPTDKNNGNDKEKNSGKKHDWKQYGLKWIEPLNIVTITLAILTYLLFRQAINDSKTAVISSQYAQDAVKEQRINDSIIRRSDSIKFTNDTSYAIKKNKNDSIINRNSYDISKHSLEAQINSIEETQQIFEKSNQPLLQIMNLDIINFKINEPVEIGFLITNLSNIPVKIIGTKTVAVIKVNPYPISEIKKFLIYTNTMIGYVTKESPMGEHFDFPTNLTVGQHDRVIKDNSYIYLIREIIYKNLVTDKIRKYMFYIKMKPIKKNASFPNGTYYTFIYNENYDKK